MPTTQKTTSRQPGGDPPSKGSNSTTQPLRKHRTWEITTKRGDLERQLEAAGLNPTLRAIGKILDRCKAGAKLAVTAYEVTEPTAPEKAKEHLRQEGMIPCCACEFSSWAIAHGNDVDQDVTWITEAIQRTDRGQPVAIALAGQTVYAFKMPEQLLAGVMLLAISAENAKHRVAQ
jgi:hypothetical protein